MEVATLAEPLQGKKSIQGLRGQSGPEGMACDWGAREGCDAPQSDRTQGSSSLPEQDEDKKPQKEQLEWERVQHLSTPLSIPPASISSALAHSSLLTLHEVPNVALLSREADH